MTTRSNSRSRAAPRRRACSCSVFDLLYAGVFRIVNVPQENIHAIIMIECPRLLFPFAREIVGNSVRNGGFPPLMIDPVDFVSLYRQKLSEQQPQAVPTA